MEYAHISPTSFHVMGAMRPKPYTANKVAAALVMIADHTIMGAGQGRFQKWPFVLATKSTRCPATAILRNT